MLITYSDILSCGVDFRKVGIGNFLMGTECLDTRFPGFPLRTLYNKVRCCVYFEELYTYFEQFVTDLYQYCKRL